MPETMKAGHELNALIAEKVIGLAFNDDDGAWRHEGFFYCLGEELPDYSTDVAASHAMEEELKRRNLHTEYADILATIATSGWETFDPGDAWHLAHASPLQRCLAALRAVGVTLDNDEEDDNG